MSVIPPREGGPRKKWAGLGLVGLSGVWFCLVFLVQLSGFTLEIRVVLSTSFFLLMEGTFYLGLFLLGKRLAKRYLGSLKAKIGIR